MGTSSRALSCGVRLAGLAVAALLVAACGGSDENDSTSAGTPPDDAVVVVGTATCSLGDEPDPDQTVECEHSMSDPRVSGTEVSTAYTFIDNTASPGFAWAAEDSVITNAEGTWRGSLAGVDDGSGGGGLGEAHYLGEGAYEGLEYHYYLGGLEQVEVLGWISGEE